MNQNSDGKINSQRANKSYSQKTVSQDTLDLIIIGDSHLKDFSSNRLYKNKKVKIHVLGAGQKNISGAKDYINSSSSTCKNFVVMVGSNDLTQGKSVSQIHKELMELSELITSKFRDCILNIVPLFHRLDQRKFNTQVDEINKKLLSFRKENVVIMRNSQITSRQRFLFYGGIHLCGRGTIELATMIKENLNEQLGLKPYADYSYNSY